MGTRVGGLHNLRMEPVTLTTERLLLRPLEPRDTEAVFAACQDPEIPRFTEIPTAYTELEARSWIESHAALQAAGQALDLAIVEPGSDRMVGAIGLTRLESAVPAAGEIGYWVARDARRRGSPFEAERIGTQMGTEQYGIGSASPGHTARPPVALTTVGPDDVLIRSGP